jgi:hypothetical protein
VLVSVLSGTVTAVVATALSLLSFLLYFELFSKWDPASDAARTLLASVVMITPVAVGVAVLYWLPKQVARLWGVERGLAVLVGGLLLLLTLPGWAFYASVVNGCSLHVGVPFSGPCAR